MSAGTSALFFPFICFLVCSSEAQKIIRAELGQEVVLPCKAPDQYKVLITAVKWIRPDQDPDYVLLYRDGHFDPHNQHPSYQNRVDLQDEEMKDGDVSLVLKDVMKNDSGRYECRVYENGRKELTIINLEVLLSGNEDRSTGVGGDKDGLIVGSVVGVILLLLVASVGFLITRRHMRQIPKLLIPDSVKAAAKQMFETKT